MYGMVLLARVLFGAPMCTPGFRFWLSGVRVCCEPELNVCEIGLIGDFRKKRVRVSQKAPLMQKKKNKSLQSQKHQAVTMSLLRVMQRVGLPSPWAMKKRCTSPFLSCLLCFISASQFHDQLPESSSRLYHVAYILLTGAAHAEQKDIASV